MIFRLNSLLLLLLLLMMNAYDDGGGGGERLIQSDMKQLKRQDDSLSRGSEHNSEAWFQVR
jgi:hypothetical protein